MSARIDETGNRYGRLLVLKEAPRKKGGHIRHWWCRCDCGKEKKISEISLRNGSTKSCGCLHREIVHKNEAGKRYGKWLVLEEEPQGHNGAARWRCRCDCGTERAVLGYQLRRGGSTSCGCNRKKVERRNMIDETGHRYGRWLVLGEAPRKPNNTIYWLCRCDCGTESVISGYSLRYGRTKSCGCGRNIGRHQSKSVRARISRANTIDEMGHKYSHLLVIKKSPNRKNGLVCWRCLCDCGKYVTATGDALRKGRATSCGCQKKVK
jgi:hypothetical protein